MLELDKICRVCISERKDMRPLFSEKVAEMLVEFASVKVESTEGWPDKICVQCVHQISRCHAFKALVERSDRELREYIKSLTVRVVIEEQEQKQLQQQQQQQMALQREHDLKLQKSRAKLLQLQKEQEELKQQQLEQQQRILREQEEQKKLQEKQQLLLEKRNATVAARKAQRKKLQAEKQKQLLEKVDQLQQHQQSQQQHQQYIVNSTPNAVVTNTGTNINSNNLPQQLLLSNNGQIITTAQILSSQNSSQLAVLPAASAQHVNTATNTTLAQPQLIQTTSGHTLQLIQQPNGQHALQFIQLMPPRTLSQTALGNIVTLTSSANDEGETIVNLVDDSNQMAEEIDENEDLHERVTLLEDSHEQHLLDDVEQMDDVSSHIYANDLTDEDEDDDIETILIKDESLPQPQHMQQVSHQSQLFGVENVESYGNHETQELEYLEDITVTTTAGQQLQQQQQMHAVMQVSFVSYQIIEKF